MDANNLPRYPDLAGKVAVVTGGTRGIGAQTARALASNGAKVMVTGRDEAAIEAVVGEIRAGGGVASGLPADVTDYAAIEQVRWHTEDELGPTDVLVAFAGGGKARPGPLHETSEEDWHSTVDGSLTATFLTLKSFLPGMAERRRGSIVTMASLAGRVAATGAPVPYGVAKAGIITLTQEVAAQYGPRQVRANCVAPSTIVTERISQQMPAEFRERVLALHPLGRLGEAGDVAQTTLFLASDASSWLTGLTIDVAGGRFMA